MSKYAPNSFYNMQYEDQLKCIRFNSTVNDLEAYISNKGYHNFSKIPTNELPVDIIGLGTNFVPVSNFKTEKILSSLQEFKRSIRLRTFFGNTTDSSYNPRFHVKSSNWEPPPEKIHPSVNGYLDIVQAKIESKILRPSNFKIKLNYYKKDMIKLKQLILNNDIVIKNADKNLGLSILDGSWYREECLKQLNDINYYTANPRNTNVKDSLELELEYMDMFRSMVETNSLSNQERKFLLKYIHPSVKALKLPTPRNRQGQFMTNDYDKPIWIYPSFYIIPKIHKSPMTGRPLVPSHSYLTTALSSYVDFHLQKAIKATHIKNYILQDSKTLINELNSLVLPSDCMIFTGDVSSLYTNIPLSSIGQVTAYLRKFNKTIYSHNQCTALNIAMKFIMTHNFFVFNKQVYQQKAGVAMGTPCAPSFANLYLQFLETLLFNDPNYPDHLKPLYYKRYIDDILVILPNNADLHFFPQHSKAYRNLQVNWTNSIRNKGLEEIEFLDVVIYKDLDFPLTSKLSTRVHQKVLNRYLYIPFNSNHPRFQMRSWIKTELIRYIRNSSKKSDFLEIKAKFASRLRVRGYPTFFIKSTFSQVSYESRDSFLSPSPTRTKKSQPLIFKATYHPFLKNLELTSALNPNESILGKLNNNRPMICYKKSKSLGSLINGWMNKSHFYNPRHTLSITTESHEESIPDVVYISDSDTRPQKRINLDSQNQINSRSIEIIDLCSSPTASQTSEIIWISD